MGERSVEGRDNQNRGCAADTAGGPVPALDRRHIEPSEGVPETPGPDTGRTSGRRDVWNRGSGTAPGPRPAERCPNERWSMDIVVDRLASGRPFQILMLVDTANLTSPAIAVDFAMAGEHIVAVLDRLASEQGLPAIISADNGRLFASRSLAAWAGRRGISLEHPQAARVAFNSRLRRGCLARHRFADLDEARRAIEEWRIAANAAALVARPD